MENKLLVLVPYREREQHLSIFLEYIEHTLYQQKIDYKLGIVEQSKGSLFNRGLLLNIGYQIFHTSENYICLHDVDIIGETFDYTYNNYITHLSRLDRNNNYLEWYSNYLGGVVLFPSIIFESINGFSNEYWGWGAEDDDLRHRCDTLNKFIHKKNGKYFTLPHKKSGYIKNCNDESYKKNVDRLRHFMGLDHNLKIDLIESDGLKQSLNYCNDIKYINTKHALIQIKDEHNRQP